SGLRPEETMNSTENVLNGIAYDASNNRLYVTGKRWPKLFEIRLKKK
ncbi:MAG: glutaminyl-peptide cyclotransferase, partial [Pyrinomonadaceae bacterium]|nr:glutaminyl-peptide cyclotransferase [Pyrinomonadaceae bacterium]